MKGGHNDPFRTHINTRGVQSELWYRYLVSTKWGRSIMCGPARGTALEVVTVPRPARPGPYIAALKFHRDEIGVLRYPQYRRSKIS